MINGTIGPSGKNGPLRETSTVIEKLRRMPSIHEYYHGDADLYLLSKACAAASEKLDLAAWPDLRRAVGVATVLAVLGMDTATLVSALQYDNKRDVGYSLAMLCRDFGPELATLAEYAADVDEKELRRQVELLTSEQEFSWMPAMWQRPAEKNLSHSSQRKRYCNSER